MEQLKCTVGLLETFLRKGASSGSALGSLERDLGKGMSEATASHTGTGVWRQWMTKVFCRQQGLQARREPASVTVKLLHPSFAATRDSTSNPLPG
ncbi:hypothetical protein P7K49_032586, partial [Saguinus oedipus]